MKNMDCNQIKIFINLEIIGKEDKEIYISFFFFNLTKFLQFSEATRRNHDF